MSLSIRSRERIVQCVAAIAILTLRLSSATAAPITVSSPDGKTRIDITVDAGGQLTWSVQRQNKVVLSPAPLGLTIDDVNLGQSVALGAPRTSVINEQYPTR